MIIVTSGFMYTDIDVYAGIISYAELLRLQGMPAQAISTAAWNESISKTVRSWPTQLKTSYTPNKDDRFIVIDVSEPDHFSEIVDLDRVDEIIDHHLGSEDYWQKRIGDKAQIEFIGSVCTIIFEKWLESGLLDKMDETNAKLLVSGILDNTLNLKAQVTTDRDKNAYNALVKHAKIPKSWTTQYFSECQESILKDVKTSIVNDSKVISYPSFPRPLSIGQLTVWSAKDVLANCQDTIEQTLSNFKPDWFMNLISIEEGSSYFICKSLDTQKWLANLLGIRFENNIAKADRLWLRKEITQQVLKTQK